MKTTVDGVTPRTYLQFAGYRSCVVNRWTRTRICIVDGAAAQWDTDIRSDGGHGSRWYTTCEDHSVHVSHPTLKLARAHSTSPWDWCEQCRNAGVASPVPYHPARGGRP